MSEDTPSIGRAHASDAVQMHRGSVALHGLIESEHSNIDGRTTWPRRYRQLFDQYIGDLGGIDAASTAKQSLVRRATVMEIELERMEAKLAVQDNPSDKLIDLYQRTAGGLRRLLETIGLERQAKTVSALELTRSLALVPQRPPSGEINES